MKTEKVVFPYPDLDAAVKDRFKKIGGPAEAFRYLRRGYQELQWRARWHERYKQRLAEEDAQFAAENAGRKPAK